MNWLTNSQRKLRRGRFRNISWLQAKIAYDFRDNDEYKLTVSRRKAEVTLNQLRANCSPLVCDFHTAETYNLICQACLLRIPETVYYLLRPGRTIARQKHLGPNSRATIEDLCTKYPMQVLGFLLDEGLLRDEKEKVGKGANS